MKYSQFWVTISSFSQKNVELKNTERASGVLDYLLKNQATVELHCQKIIRRFAK